MPRVGFEPTIPVFELAKTVHALDRAAIVIGFHSTLLCITNLSILYIIIIMDLQPFLLGRGRFFSFLILYTDDRTL
jgi:hypothetical protein